MHNNIFLLRFAHHDGTIEEQEYCIADDAWNAFRMFAEPDSSEIYACIVLVEYSFKTERETPLAQMRFYPA